MIMEYASGGELFNKIKSEKFLEEPIARFYFQQLIGAVEHCHSRGICHRSVSCFFFILRKYFFLLVCFVQNQMVLGRPAYFSYFLNMQITQNGRLFQFNEDILNTGNTNT
jgi:serine/threonine protein kinase